MARVCLTLAERFWAKVLKTEGCWLWTGCTLRGGYGLILGNSPSKLILAHRASWELANGPIPEGLCVCHHCDSDYPVGDITYRRCVNPDHLFLGTSRDNTQDAAAKGRMAHGSNNGNARLTEASVRTIRARYAAGGIGQVALAREVGVSQCTVWRVLQGMVWKHVQ